LIHGTELVANGIFRAQGMKQFMIFVGLYLSSASKSVLMEIQPMLTQSKEKKISHHFFPG
jgi:hypothetical protein